MGDSKLKAQKISKSFEIMFEKNQHLSQGPKESSTEKVTRGCKVRWTVPLTVTLRTTI
jgi:hypothetical protein